VADCFLKEQRSEYMSRIRSTNTRAEVVLDELLRAWLAGFTVERCVGHVPGKPDFFVPELNLAVFVDGCFFHGCPLHYRAPDDNAEYWRAKLERNRNRDREVNRRLRAQGVRVIRIWEHELRGKPPVGSQRLRSRIARARRLALHATTKARTPAAPAHEEPAAERTGLPGTPSSEPPGPAGRGARQGGP